MDFISFEYIKSLFKYILKWKKLENKIIMDFILFEYVKSLFKYILKWKN